MYKNFKKKYGPRLPGNGFSLLALLKHILIKKYLQKKYNKESIYLETSARSEMPVHIPERKLNYIALVYDSVVEEMIRVDDVTAKFLLGGAELVRYDPKTTEVKKQMLYYDGHFIEKPKEDEIDEAKEG
jgi:hypothetical protein